jgi:hypothetical protein
MLALLCQEHLTKIKPEPEEKNKINYKFSKIAK